jgi:hypothetical protein
MINLSCLAARPIGKPILPISQAQPWRGSSRHVSAAHYSHYLRMRMLKAILAKIEPRASANCRFASTIEAR